MEYSNNRKFLADKKWWVEEDNKKCVLFVEHNAKVYTYSRNIESLDLTETKLEYGKKSSFVELISLNLVEEIKGEIIWDEYENKKRLEKS